MTTFSAVRDIQAPIDLVFRTVSEVENFREAIPHITNVEFLSETRTGVGARFKETRMMNGREATTELEVTEFEPGSHVRFVSDSHGTVWDTVFAVTQQDGGTRLSMVMEARPHAFMAKLTVPMIKGMVAKALEEDMDAVKSYCESKSA